MPPTPFTINVPDASIEQLKKKLETATYPDELSGSEWTYGSPAADIKRLVNYWAKEFDWRKQEAWMNKLPNFRTKVEVDGFGAIDMHFVHQQNANPAAIPLLFVHGWPGSFIEVSKLLPLLKGGDGKPAFHIVAPSLPNFGFTDGIKQPGFTLAQYAEAFNKLMESLGYHEYVTQGGDWGFYITRAIGLLYPKQCKASHINMIRARPPTFSTNPVLALQHQLTPYTEYEKRGVARLNWFMTEGQGYRTQQATKPQTLAYSLADSPVGLLAWIYEKLHDWTDGYPWTPEEICTWVSIYWFSVAGPGASVRIYYEATHDTSKTNRDRVSEWIPTVPLGMAYFPKELGVPPRTWCYTLGPVAFESRHEKGGHFAAWEQPDSIAGDLNKMFGRNGPCAGVVKGKNGYDGASSGGSTNV